MAAGGAGGADAKAAQVQVDVVGDDEDALQRDLIKAHGVGDSVAGEVHEGLGLHQKDLSARHIARRRQGVVL